MTRFARIVIVLIALLAGSVGVLAAPSSPSVHVLTQPDGTSFDAFQWGDEWFHGWETLDGYTITRNETTGYWEYAHLGAGGKLEPAGKRPGTAMPCDSMARRLRPSPEVIMAERPPGSDVSARAVPTKGTVNLPVILISFNDRVPTYTVRDFNELLFASRPSIATGPGSMKDYYQEVSYGAFTVSPGPSGVSGWHTAAHEHDYYGYENGHSRAAQLVKEAVLAADPYIDFRQYDNDHDGSVDCVIVIHQGRGHEDSGDNRDVWSHKWSLSAAGVGVILVDGVTVNDYTMQPERFYSSMSSVGIFAHEFGHALGLPDLYDIDYSSEGVGNWCLMSGGSWNSSGGKHGDTPAHMSAWCKWRLGWVEPQVVKGGQPCQAIHAAAGQADVLQFLLNPGGPNDWHWYYGGVGEYFLVENRFKTGFDSGLPGSGLAIWHVDESQTTNADELHKLVDLEEADGYNDLDLGNNRGDAGDVFPGTSLNIRFGDLTRPDNRWYDQRNTGCSIRNISDPGLIITADLSQYCACTGSSYDDMGMRLWKSDMDYFDIRGDFSRLSDPKFLELFRSIYINSANNLTVTSGMSSAIRGFIDNGGELLATDWAYPIITKAFPGHINFLGDDPRIGVAGPISAVSAKNPALARYLGAYATEGPLVMDVGYWTVIDSVADYVEVALTGDIQVDTTNPPRFASAPNSSAPQPITGVETLYSKPLVVSFPYGKGTVMYSSAHMHAQAYAGASQSRLQPIGNGSLERLAMWNVLATLTNTESTAAVKANNTYNCKTTDGIVDLATPGDCLEYEIVHAAVGKLVVSAATSSGVVDMVLYDPNGRVAAASTVDQDLATMMVPQASPGKWTLQTTVRNGNDSPAVFVACIGEGSSSGPELAAGEVRFGPNPASTVLNVYYSTDADASFAVYDVTGRMAFSCLLPSTGHQLMWDLTTADGRPLANGLYMCVVRSGNGIVGLPFRLVIQR